MHYDPMLRVFHATPRQWRVADQAVARFEARRRRQQRLDDVADIILFLLWAAAVWVGSLLLRAVTS